MRYLLFLAVTFMVHLVILYIFSIIYLFIIIIKSEIEYNYRDVKKNSMRIVNIMIRYYGLSFWK